MDLNCELCANKKECFDNHWCVTMDRKRKINNEYICDNFELSGRKYEELKEKNKKLEEEKEAFARSYVQASDNEAAAVIRSANQKNFYEKVIDIMSEDIFNGFILNFNCIEQAKEYYFKKAGGEEDDKT